MARSGQNDNVQLSSWHGAALSARYHSACCWSNIAPSTAICIVIRSCIASNTSFVAWRPKLCGCYGPRAWNSLPEFVTFHLQEISQDLLI